MEDGSKEKPKRASILSTMQTDTITLDEALALLALPRVVGVSEGAEITALNGRYGPYLKKGDDSRSLDSEEQLFSVTLEQAEAIFAQPKQRRGRAAKPPIAALGAHPDSGANVRVLDGRFGPYVTDGTINATVPRGVEPSSIDLEQAVELLREREARGPAQKRPAKKKAPAKTTKRVIKKGTSKTSKAGKARAAKKKVAMTTGTGSTEPGIPEPASRDAVPPPTDEDQPETEAETTL
jgi:DNA topoisomerase-1